MRVLNFLFTKIEIKIELFRNIQIIKNVCKKNHIRVKFKDDLITVQKELYQKVFESTQQGGHTPFNKEEALYHTLILSRAYQLNREMLLALKNDMYHSAIALTREMIEVFIATLYTNIVNPDYLNFLIWKKEEKEYTRYGNLISLIKQKLIASNKKERVRYIELILQDWQYFSSMFHPSQKSFYRSVWSLNKNERSQYEAKFLKDDFNNKDQEILIFLTAHFPESEINMIVNRFYHYMRQAVINSEQLYRVSSNSNQFKIKKEMRDLEEETRKLKEKIEKAERERGKTKNNNL